MHFYALIIEIFLYASMASIMPSLENIKPIKRDLKPLSLITRVVGTKLHKRLTYWSFRQNFSSELKIPHCSLK